MSPSKILNTLGLALVLATGGCFAEGAADGDVGTNEQDIGQAPAVVDEPATQPAPKTGNPGGNRKAGPDALPICDSCGDPVPWTPPRGALHVSPSGSDDSK